MITEFINTYGLTIIYAALTALAGYIGIVVKNIYKKYIDSKEKREVVSTCVKAVEQIYTDLHGEEKYNKAVEAISEMLAAKGITFTEFEIKMLIEASCSEFVKTVQADEKEEDLKTE